MIKALLLRSAALAAVAFSGLAIAQPAAAQEAGVSASAGVQLAQADGRRDRGDRGDRSARSERSGSDRSSNRGNRTERQAPQRSAPATTQSVPQQRAGSQSRNVSRQERTARPDRAQTDRRAQYQTRTGRERATTQVQTRAPGASGDRNRTYTDTSRNRTYTTTRVDRRDDRNNRYDRNDRNSRYDRDDRRSDYRQDHRRWNNNWRNDRRYNWSSYRNSNRNVYRVGRYYSPYSNYSYSRLRIGLTLGNGFYNSRYWINDPWQYRLPEVYGSYRWVRYYDDVLLVDVYSGEVVDVIHDFFW